MPVARLSRRRKSSHALFAPAKPGIYGIPARPVTFAPNVTPVTYVDTDESTELAQSGAEPAPRLFPPSETPAPPPTRKRCPPGKRRSQGYIPRPPNAFMLFRADFVRQKHVPGSIETNHGSLSKIIGTCWRQLPLEEKRIWEVRAKQEKAAHKIQFPDYRFRPVHNKNKNNNNNAASNQAIASSAAERREKQITTPEDERRCEEVAQLLLEGKKGEELAAAVRNLDRRREREFAAQVHAHAAALASTSMSTASLPPSTASNSPNAMPTLHMPLPVPGLSPGWMNMGTSSAMGSYARRPSSVPLPNDFFSAYNYPNGAGVPFLAGQDNTGSPIASISRQGQHTFASAGGFAQQPQGFSGYQFQGQQNELAYPTQDFSEVLGMGLFSNPFGPRASMMFNSRASLGLGFSRASFSNYANVVNNSNNSTIEAANGFPPPSFSPFASGFGHPTLAQRNSLGLGLGRRASSAQPMMQRSWDANADQDNVFAGMHDAYHQHQQHAFGGWGAMPFGEPLAGGHAHHAHSQSVPMAMADRDPSPLPDVEPELFAPDFSFGSSASSASSESASPPSSTQTAQQEPVSPVDVSPVAMIGARPHSGMSPVELSPHDVDPRTTHAYTGSCSPTLTDAAPLGSHAHGDVWTADPLMNKGLALEIEMGMDAGMGVSDMHTLEVDGLGYYDEAY